MPATTAERYFAATVNDVLVTSEVDGLPQRVIVNELVSRLASSNRLTLLLRALRSALQYRKLSGASLGELIRSGLAMRSSEKMTRSQMLMAANAPILVRKAMIEGDPVGGVLPSGTVAGVITDRPSCAELIERIIHEAERTLASLAN
jgi:NAD(P)H-dependent flavin oxidoreductase YrpB (nitropropane dioxygenase family)